MNDGWHMTDRGIRYDTDHPTSLWNSELTSSHYQSLAMTNKELLQANMPNIRFVFVI
ncbi:MAG: hypothetical protein M3O67_09535 [Bacteroidota bacterium]|nr:hypothetical protein [Bacteroidota bacterium]